VEANGNAWLSALVLFGFMFLPLLVIVVGDWVKRRYELKRGCGSRAPKAFITIDNKYCCGRCHVRIGYRNGTYFHRIEGVTT